jgi:hypothetical protein
VAAIELFIDNPYVNLFQRAFSPSGTDACLHHKKVMPSNEQSTFTSPISISILQGTTIRIQNTPYMK